MKLYHGSIVDIQRIDLNISKPNISFEEFTKRLHYIKGITFQYAFCTQKAIDQLIKL